MQVMARFVSSYCLVKWLLYRIYDQKVTRSSPCVFFFTFILFLIRFSSFIIDVPGTLSNDIWIVIFQMVDA